MGYLASELFSNVQCLFARNLHDLQLDIFIIRELELELFSKSSIASLLAMLPLKVNQVLVFPFHT